MHRKAILPALAAVFVLSGAAIASADDLRLDDAWEDAVGDQENILTEAQFATLNNLAFQAAVPKVCDGYALDDAKFAQAMSEAAVPPSADLTPEQMKEWETAVLIRFGTTYGLFLAEGNAGKEAFCASAAELRNNTEVPHYWK
jgi:hypothetical protein